MDITKKGVVLETPAPFWRKMWPTWPQVGFPKRPKIDVKIDQKFDASWDRFGGGFWKILGAKMEPCWHPKGTQDASYLKSTGSQKNLINPIEFP